MLIECKNCGHTLDPNDSDAPWAPPVTADGKSVGSLICPGCDTRADFVDWKSLTAKEATKAADR